MAMLLFCNLHYMMHVAYTHPYTYIHICIHTYMHMYMYTYRRVDMYSRVYICYVMYTFFGNVWS